jgi:hypothetical protein
VLEIFMRRPNTARSKGDEDVDLPSTPTDIGTAAARTIMQQAMGVRLKDWDTQNGVIII